MRTANLKIYSFDELSETARENAIAKWVETDDMPFLADYMADELERLLAENKLTSDNAEVRYSLSYSQGDGASFTGDIEWRGVWRGTIETNSWGVHYQHSATVTLTELTSLKTDREAPDETCRKLQTIIEAIGDELARIGYEYIKAEQLPENVAENLRANEYEFTADGKFYYGENE